MDELTAEISNDIARDDQPQAQAVGLRAGKRLEEGGDDRRRYGRAVVGNVELDPIFARGDRKVDLRIRGFRQRVERIAQQVHQHLFQPDAFGTHPQSIGVSTRDACCLSCDTIAQKQERAIDRIIEQYIADLARCLS